MRIRTTTTPYATRSTADRYDLVVAMYGRLRRIAELTAGRTGQFVSVGGVPAYRGWMHPWLHEPAGLPVPVAEDAPMVTEPHEDEKGYRIVRTEQAVFDHHPSAAHFRYPYVYGPYQLVPREWLIVRRMLDGRDRIVVADDGLTLHHHGYTENLAHAVLLAVDDPAAAGGNIFNVGDEEVLTIRQVDRARSRAALGHSTGDRVDAVRARSAGAARCSRSRCRPTACSISRAYARCSATTTPCPRARRSDTPRGGSQQHPCERGGQEETVLTDPFDYPAEDDLIAAWQRALATVDTVRLRVEPGYGLAYSGPGGRSRTSTEFDA